ncbi:MAG: phosphate ABC transporter ATP-binding protein [Anaerolineae bacterium]
MNRPADTPIYRLDSLRQVYAGRTVLEIGALEVRPAEILALVGPSGSGKSTLLRLLNFLEAPVGGTITFLGRPICDGRPPLALRRQVTTVFQRPVLLRTSVWANVSYGLRLRGLKADGRVDEVLAQVGLADLARRPAVSLSGGEMQRVALARALVVRPTVLLLDEPTANLDPYNVGLIEEIIRRHNREHGTTVVLVTHNVFQARRLAHRVGLLLGGRLVELADVHTFFAAPSDPRTAAFVRGEMVY